MPKRKASGMGKGMQREWQREQQKEWQINYTRHRFSYFARPIHMRQYLDDPCQLLDKHHMGSDSSGRTNNGEKFTKDVVEMPNNGKWWLVMYKSEQGGTRVKSLQSVGEIFVQENWLPLQKGRKKQHSQKKTN